MIIRVRLLPNAARNQIVGKEEGVYKIRLTAALIEGKANEALIRFLAHHLDIAPSCITLLKGHTSKYKTLEISHPTKDIESRLLAALD